jgi:hypothetical protein
MAIYANSNNNDRFRRLTFDQVYTRSLGLLVDRLDLFLVIAAVMYLPLWLIDSSVPAVLEKIVNKVLTHLHWTDALDDGTIANQMAYWAGLYSTQHLLFQPLVGIVGQAAMVRAVAELYANEHPPDTQDCLKWALGSFCTIFCGHFVVGIVSVLVVALVAVLVLLLLMSDNAVLIILAVVLVVAAIGTYTFVTIAVTTLFIPVVIIEGKAAVEGLQRSFEMLSKNCCYVLCTWLGLTLIMGMVSGAISFGILTVFDHGLLGNGLAQLPFLVWFPLRAICSVVIYLNLRVIHEDLNRDVLARELNSATSSSSGGDYYRLDDEEAGGSSADDRTTHEDLNNRQDVLENEDPLNSSSIVDCDPVEPCMAVAASAPTHEDLNDCHRDVLAREQMNNTLGHSADYDLVEAQAVCIAEQVKRSSSNEV